MRSKEDQSGQCSPVPQASAQEAARDGVDRRRTVGAMVGSSEGRSVGTFQRRKKDREEARGSKEPLGLLPRCLRLKSQEGATGRTLEG